MPDSSPLRIICTTEAGIRVNLARLAADLEGAESVYLASLSGLSEDRLQQVLLTINSHKLPSMSMTGLSYVNKGAFCSVSGEVDAQKLARRIALNLQRITMNDDPANFQVDFTHPERLAINMQTAREIEVSNLGTDDRCGSYQ